MTPCDGHVGAALADAAPASSIESMRLLLTGSTGYIGSAVLDELLRSGHEVVAVVRSEASAEAAAARGAHPVVGELADATWFAGVLAEVDGAVHLAAPAEGAEALNAAVVDAAVAAFSGTGKPFVLTSGIWEFGAGELDDERPVDPPALVAWRVPIEDRLLAADVEATVLAPAVVHGRGRGLLGVIAGGPRRGDGALTLVGDGEQHWSWVHVDDLARLYRLVVEHGGGLGRLIGADGSPTTVRAVAEAVAGEAGVAPEPAEATRARLGEAFADVLLLDQRASARRARALGWTVEHPSVLDGLAAAVAAG